MIRREYVEICGGNRVAAALLNECEFVTKRRLSEGESPWFRRKAAYWVAALQGEAGERTIRDAFKAIKSLGLVEFKQANGDQAGAFYRFNIERVQAAIDGLEPERLEDDPGRFDRAPQSELPTTPAETTGHPGKNDRGSHLLYTRAPEPLLEPLKNQTDRACLPDSSSTEETGDRLLRAILRSTPRFRASTRRRQEWERVACESGLGLDTLAQIIELHGQELAEGCKTPVLLIGKAKERYEEGQSGVTAPASPTLDAVRVAEMWARNGDAEGHERLQRYAKCGDEAIEKAARSAILRTTWRQFRECGRVEAGGLAALKTLRLCGDPKVEKTARLALLKVAESQTIPMPERSRVQAHAAA